MIQAVVKNRLTTSSFHHRPVICHVIHAMGVGGAEVLVSQMARLMGQQYRCVVAVLDEVGELGQRLRDDGFPVEHLGRRPGIDRRCAERLRAFADREGASLLHAHQCTPFFQAMLSRGLTGRRPVVFTEHGRHFPDLPSRKRAIVNRLLLRKCDRLIACGESVRQALIKNEGLPESRVELIYNGVDIRSLSMSSADARSRIRREFGYAEDDFVVIQIARLHELKDHQTALRTIDRVRKVVPTARLLLAGDGDQRSSIEEAISTRGLTSHVQLAGTRRDIADLLAASDAFLLTSISEGIPLTVIEAMAAGLPVVATSVGGLPEMIRDGISGCLASASDDLTLSDHLIRLAGQPSQRQQMGQVAIADAHARFSLDAMLKSYARVYREVLAGVPR